jgi:beta-lactam-binding protein with PASTA domain
MSAKDFFDKIFSRYLLLHLAAMALVIILLCVGIGFGLNAYTHHGEGIAVPDLKGVDYEKAYRQLDELGLRLVVSDSGYNKRLPAHSVLAQVPGGGVRVKQGRIIYVTINSPSSPTFAIPDIVDNSSVREAEAKLMAIGFQLTEPQLVEGEKDWVYGIVCRGRRVSNGDRLSVDYPLTLLVGKGAIDDMSDIDYMDPAMEGMTATGDVDEFVEVKEPVKN